MNENNLVPLTTEKAREIGEKGGKASVKARREKKMFSQIYAEMLVEKYDVRIDGSVKQLKPNEFFKYVVRKILVGGGSPAVSILREMREALEGKTVHVSGSISSVDIPYDSFTEQQKEAICAANEALAGMLLETQEADE